MFKSVYSIAALLLATAILYAGNGLQGTLLAVRGGLEGFPTGLIGALMSAYFVGFILGCRFVPQFIKSVGHIRTFVALASIASSSALAHALFVDVYAWAILRGITGFAFAGLAMVLESWINDRASNENRGKVLSLYRIADLGALTLGNALLASASPLGFHLFALVSILISIALVPVALTRSPAPPPIATARLDLTHLYRASPLAAVGAVTTGLTNAAFWGVAPVFAQQLGFAPAAIAGFMSSAIVGAALAQFPLGWLSDKIDRRRVIVATVLAAIAAALAIALLGGRGPTWLLVFGSLFGSQALCVFGLCVAHANDHARVGESVATSGGMLLLHGVGATIGATSGALSMAAFGPPSLFIYIASVYGCFLLFALARMFVRAAPTARKGRFVPAPRSPSTRVYRRQNNDAGKES